MAATSWEMQLRAVGKNRKRERRIEINKPKRRSRRPPWDATSSDLSVFKPSAAELDRRHQLHKPKPLSERKYLQRYQDLLLEENKENLVNRKTIYKDHVERKKALIKEIFTNQEMELSNVLAETDRAMANVKDLFGDDPMKFKAIPHITDAPYSTKKLNGSLLAIDIATPSRLTALSDSVMKHPAINDVVHDFDEAGSHSDDYESDCEDTYRNEERNGISYQSNFDFEYYNNLLRREQVKDDDHSSTGPKHDPCRNQDTSTRVTGEAARDFHRNDQIEAALSKRSMASNALQNHENSNIDNEKGRTFKGGDNQSPDQSRSKISSLNEFDQLKKEIQFLVDGQKDSSSINPVESLIQFIKKLSFQVETERQSREHLLEEFQEQRALIDALTGDLIYSQEEYEKLRLEFERFRTEAKNEILQLKNEMQTLSSKKQFSSSQD